MQTELSVFFNEPSIDKTAMTKQFPKYNSTLILKTAIQEFEKIDIFQPTSFKIIMDNIQNQSRSKSKELWQTIRFALTGKIHGPDLASFISILGLNRCIQRFKNAS